MRIGRFGPGAVSKPSIGFKVKADAEFKPEEYTQHFEDLNSASNAGIKPKGWVCNRF